MNNEVVTNSKSSRETEDLQTFVSAEKLPALLTKLRSGEALAGLHLTLVARFTSDPWARRHLTRHSADEMKHALVFEQIARQLDLEYAVSFDALDNEPRRDRFALHELTPLTGNLYSALLEGRPVPQLVLGIKELYPIIHELNRAERVGLSIFHGLRDLLSDDDRASKVGNAQRRANACSLLSSIIEDERYHLAWTASALQRWQNSVSSADKQLNKDKEKRDRDG